MGWYHSHPFDVDEQHNHCYLSSTDLSTQLQWQRSEDPHGNPWLAIVVDPLRSLAKSHPEFGAFRVYPPEFTAPVNETPDGKIVEDDTKRVEHWGACWNRYYQLKVEYFMSSQVRAQICGALAWRRRSSDGLLIFLHAALPAGQGGDWDPLQELPVDAHARLHAHERAREPRALQRAHRPERGFKAGCARFPGPRGGAGFWRRRRGCGGVGPGQAHDVRGGPCGRGVRGPDHADR